MIKQIGITELPNDDNVFLTKIVSNTLCYGKFDFCSTFVQENCGQKTAFINILSGSAVVFASSVCNYEELSDFLRFNSVNNIFCNEDCAKNLEFKSVLNGLVLEYNGFCAEKFYSLQFAIDYKSVYSLMAKSFSLPDYNEFVADLSYRLNHGFARALTTEDSVAISAWETKNAVVISAIAVDITKRGCGIGTKLVSSLVHSCISDKKRIFVYCETENVRFYINNGFHIIGNYFVGKDF